MAEPPRDALTGLPGMDAVHQRLAEWQAQAAGGGDQPAIHALLLGLRRFDAVNLAYGPAAGDAALAEVALRMVHFAGEELDGPFVAARAGGGQFVLIANEACSRERWKLFADQLADAVARPIVMAGESLRLSPRLALLRVLAGESGRSVLDRLGQALEAASRQQGRRLAWADGETSRAGRSAAQLEADLLRALERDEIEVVYQPQYGLPGNGLCGAEALARWNHPRLGRIGAGALFTIAERADHVAPVSRHVARLAMAGARHWPESLRLSLNVTPSDLAEPGFAAGLLATARDCDFPAGRLTVEVTEHTLLQDFHLAGRLFGELAARGVRIALDDFGAGFCNFRYLKVLPLDYLKLDRAMVDGVTADPRDLAVLRGIVAMARALDLGVIAEGIESEAQRAVVEAEGCLAWQGFLGAQPMGAADFLDLARRLAGNRR